MRLFSGLRPTETLDLAQTVIEPFDSRRHIYNRFDCGRTPQNRFLKNKAKRAEARLEQRVFVTTVGENPNCIAYYAMQLGSDSVPDLPREQQTYLKNHLAFPAVHLSYLAVDKPFQRQGLGQYLLMDVFQRVAEISKHAGFYALTLQSLDDESTAFYKRIGFETYSEGGAQPKMLYPIENVLATVYG